MNPPPDIFISYSREDASIARQFADGFKREGFHVWWDTALIAGEAFDQVIEKALGEAKAVVVLWSKQSVASRWVRAEATQANDNKTLVPVMIEPCKRPIIFELIHTADLSHWKGDHADPAWQALLADVRTVIGTSGRVEDAQPAPAPAPAASNRLGWWMAGIAAIVVAAAGVFWSLHGRPLATSLTRSAVSSAPPSIAVLPFKDFSPGKDQEYFADGVTEEILNSLASVPNLQVTARTSSFAFKGKDTDLRTVGATLGVRHILEGSVRKDGRQLRITAQLIDTQTDAHLWSRTYNKTLEDVFKIQEEIASAVAEELQVTLGVGIGQQAGMTRNADAYDAYLAASAEFAAYTSADRRLSIDLAEKAVSLDPSFVAAWALLAQAYQSMPSYGGNPSEQWQQKSDAAWQRVKQSMPDWPDLQFRVADLDVEQGHWQEAAEHYRIAWAAATKVGTNPWGIDGRHPPLLIESGHIREAIPMLEHAKMLDPLGPDPAIYLISAYGDAGDFKAAFAEAERGDQLKGPLNVIRHSGIAAALGNRDRAQLVKWLDAANASQSDPSMKAVDERMRALLDKPAEAVAYLHKIEPRQSATDMAEESLYFGYFGDPQGALDSLRAASRHGARALAAFNLWSAAMHDMRQLPDFKQLVHEMGLVDFWHQAGWPDQCHPTTSDDFACQ